MLRVVDTDRSADDSMLLGMSQVSFEGSNCSGVTTDTASVSSMTTEKFGNISTTTNRATRKVLGVVLGSYGNLWRSGDASAVTSTPTTAQLPSVCTRITRRPTIAIPRQYSLRNIPESVIVEEYDDSTVAPTTTTTFTMSASRFEIFRDWANVHHMDVETDSASTESFITKNGGSIVFPSTSSSTCMSPIETNYYESNDTVHYRTTTTPATTRIDDHLYCHESRCHSVTTVTKLSKSSARILELPRDIEFDSSCDSSIDGNDDDLDVSMR